MSAVGAPLAAPDFFWVSPRWFDLTWYRGYYSHMRKAGIADLKNNLSRYLDQVKSGESILVLDRNQPVAQIIPLQRGARGKALEGDRLARLERKGLIRRGIGGSGQWITKRRLVKIGGSVLQDVLDERRSGW